MGILPSKPSEASTPQSAPEFPWGLLFRWLILAYGIVSFVYFSVFSYLAPEYIPLWPRLVHSMLQILFLVGAWLLMKRRKIALPFFMGHLVGFFWYTDKYLPDMILEPNFLAKWLLSIGIIAFVIRLWHQGALR